MATIELNQRSHAMLRGFSKLRSKMQLVTDELERTGQLAKSEVLRVNLGELDKGLDEGNFLALVSDYLLGIIHDRDMLAQENEILRDELSYVHGRWTGAEVMLVEMQEERKAAEFDRKMQRYDAALGDEMTFGTRMDDWVFVEDSLMDFDDEEDSYFDDIFGTFFAPAAEVDCSVDDDGDAEMVNCDDNFLIEPTVEQLVHANDDSVRTQTAIRYFVKYLNAGQFSIAEPLCHAMIDELKSCNTEKKRDLAVALEILAMCDRSDGRYADAASCLKKALAIYEETLEAESPVIVATLNNLAMLYGQCERYDRAEPLCERALRMRKQRAGLRHRDVARQHNNMAIIHQQRHSYDAAINHYKEALDIYSTEPETPETIAASEKVKKRMASVLCQQNRFSEASDVYKDILTPTRNRVKLVIKHRPIWEVAEEVERMSAKQTLESYDLQYDYRDWYECIQVYLPNAFGALKRLAFVYRKMKMHNAAKMLEHLVTITDRKKMQLNYPPARVSLTPKALSASRRTSYNARKAQPAVHHADQSQPSSASSSRNGSGTYAVRRI